MADTDTSRSEELNTGVEDVETPDLQDEDEIEDESNEDEEQDDEESNDDSEDDSEDEDDSDDDEEEEPEFKKSFSQIKGDTPEEYIPNLEEAYRKSSTEAKRLVGENKEKQERLDQINAAVAKNPELAKAIMEATGEDAVSPIVDPGILKARQDYEEKVATDLQTFVGEHSSLEDEDTMDEFMDNLKIVGDAARKKGKILDPMLAYKKAWGMMDVDESKDKLVTAAKNTASKPKTNSGKKTKIVKTDRAKLTPEQIAYGKKFGLSEKQLLASLEK